MSAENVKLVGLLQPPPDQDIAALYRSDDASRALLEDMTPLFAPDVKVRVIGAEGESEYAGLEGMREAWLARFEPWATYRSMVVRMIDVGDHVLAVVDEFARKPDAEEEQRIQAASVWRVAGGKVSAIDVYSDREQAFRAAVAARG